MIWLLEIDELFNLKYLIINLNDLYCTWNPLCCSESQCMCDCEIFQLIVDFPNVNLAFYTQSHGISPSCNEIVPLARMGFTRTPLPSSVGSSCSELLAWAAMEFFPFIFCLFLPQSPSSVAKAVWCLPSSHRMGQWLLHLVLHVLHRVSEDISTLYPGNWCSVYIFLKIFLFTQIIGKNFSIFQNCFLNIFCKLIGNFKHSNRIDWPQVMT